MLKDNLVSIIMPSYNCEDFIQNSIQSVLKQTYRNFELIIVDDASSDNTIKVIKNIKDERIKLVINDINSGAAVSRNKGLDMASGRFIAFIDSDDLWEKEKLEKQLSIMREKNISFSFTSYKRVDENNQLLGIINVIPSVDYKILLKNTIIGCSTVMIDRERHGFFNMPLVRKGQDTATWLKLLRESGEIAYGIQEYLTTYTVRKNSISSNKFSALKRTWNIYRNVEKLSLLYSCYCFINYILNAIRKRKDKHFKEIL